MRRETLNRVSGIAPIGLSALALADVGLALALGIARGAKDEGAAAHVWQLAMAAQLPLVLVYLATAAWERPKRIVGSLALQAGAFALALAPVAILHL